MNICYVCNGYPPARKVGGIEVYTQTIARGLVRRGHYISVIGFDDHLKLQQIEDDQGVKVIRLPRPSRGVIPRMIRERVYLENAIRKEVRTSAIQLVESPDTQGGLLFTRFGAPLIVRLHGNHFVYFGLTGRKIDRLTEIFEKNTLRRADHLVSVCSFMKNETLEQAGLSHQPCEVIYNAIDTEIFKPDAGVKQVTGRILFVGRLTETKGAPNLFKALPTVFRQAPEAHLRFIGKDHLDGQGNRQSTQLAASLPEEYRRRVTVAVELAHEALPLEYQQAAVAVFPSRIEAHPIAVLEAMACGTPIVFMQNGPGPETIEHGCEGLLCDTTSPASIAEALLALLNQPEYALELGQRARQRAVRQFSLPIFLENNEKFYQRCIHQP